MREINALKISKDAIYAALLSVPLTSSSPRGANVATTKKDVFPSASLTATFLCGSNATTASSGASGATTERSLPQHLLWRNVSA
ncbi:hypothetical protein AAHA92_16806 [Salvia divinorum]|uniref:Uncharacterized protein n=1 Tax=Salvia divinorum TaxID=28513 RepID=A0ABD1GWR0_SALDI